MVHAYICLFIFDYNGAIYPWIVERVVGLRLGTVWIFSEKCKIGN